MPRLVSAATLTQAGAGVSQPLYLLQIDWATYSSRLCTHSTQTWNGQTWVGAPFEVRFDRSGRPTDIVLFDEDAAYRTLALGSGLSDRRIQLWQGYVGAMADADPVALFDGYADGFTAANGKVTFAVDYAMTASQFSPRERIGPRIGANFVAAPGTKIHWGDTIITLEAR